MNTSILLHHPYLQVMKALIARDIRLLRAQLLNHLIDALLLSVSSALLFSYLYPLIGISSTQIAPLYIGSMVGLLFNFGGNFATRIAYDLKFYRRIDYYLTLPLSATALFATFIISFIIECALVTVPATLLGLSLLKAPMCWAQVNWLGFFIMYTLTYLFFGLSFAWLAYQYSFEWLMDNMWVRRASPLWYLSCTQFVWSQVYLSWPSLGYLFLINPLTYASEGMRSALLCSGPYIWWPWCALAMIGFNGIMAYLLACAVNKRLQPV